MAPQRGAWGMDMASITKHPKGWRAQIKRNGLRKSKILPSKREATDWAARQEWLLENSEGPASKLSFGDAMDRYARDVSPKKRGARWEIIRLTKIQRDSIASVPITELTPDRLAGWRDQRLREVAPASVSREMQLLSSILTCARREWRLIKENPMSDVRKPPKPPHRERLPTTDEIERMAFVAGDDLSILRARCHMAFLFAIETGMRAGEIAGLTWDRVSLDSSVAKLVHTKNGHPREVPLSPEAMRILRALPENDPVFGMKSQSLDALWRRVRDKAGVVGLTFHDSRAEAITRLSKRLDILDLARMVGHKDLRQLQTYYREDASAIAKKLL